MIASTPRFTKSWHKTSANSANNKSPSYFPPQTYPNLTYHSASTTLTCLRTICSPFSSMSLKNGTRRSGTVRSNLSTMQSWIGTCFCSHRWRSYAWKSPMKSRGTLKILPFGTIRIAIMFRSLLYWWRSTIPMNSGKLGKLSSPILPHSNSSFI